MTDNRPFRGPAPAPPRLNWTTIYRIGCAMNARIDHYNTLQEIADELGITKQNAYTETVVALGKLVCELSRRLCLPLPDEIRPRARSLDTLSRSPANRSPRD
jgi:hypothetical protein